MADIDKRRKEQLEKDADTITNASLESTRRILQMAHEIKDIGENVTSDLAVQGEQLKRIENNLEVIEGNIDISDEILREMKCCCFPMFGRRKNKKKKLKKNVTQKNDATPTDAPNFDATPVTVGPMIKRITNDERESEMDRNLRAASDVLTDIKKMSLDITVELQKQDAVLYNISENTDRNNEKLTRNIKNTNSLRK